MPWGRADAVALAWGAGLRVSNRFGPLAPAVRAEHPCPRSHSRSAELTPSRRVAISQGGAGDASRASSRRHERRRGYDREQKEHGSMEMDASRPAAVWWWAPYQDALWSAAGSNGATSMPLDTILHVLEAASMLGTTTMESAVAVLVPVRLGEAEKVHLALWRGATPGRIGALLRTRCSWWATARLETNGGARGTPRRPSAWYLPVGGRVEIRGGESWSSYPSVGASSRCSRIDSAAARVRRFHRAGKFLRHRAARSSGCVRAPQTVSTRNRRLEAGQGPRRRSVWRAAFAPALKTIFKRLPVWRPNAAAIAVDRFVLVDPALRDVFEHRCRPG